MVRFALRGAVRDLGYDVARRGTAFGAVFAGDGYGRRQGISMMSDI